MILSLAIAIGVATTGSAELAKVGVVRAGAPAFLGPKVARMANWVEDLAVVLGTNVEVADSLSDEVLAVVASDFKPKELQAKIAECLDATWVKDGSRLRLERTKENERSMMSREQARITLRIDQWKKQAQEDLDRQGEMTPSFASALAEQTSISQVVFGANTPMVNRNLDAQSVQDDPSSLWPDGLSRDISLKAAYVDNRDCLREVPNQIQPFSLPLLRIGSATIGYQVAKQGREKAATRRFRVGHCVEMILQVHLPGGGTIAGEVEGLEALSSRAYKLSELPEPFQTRVEQAAAYYLENPNARAPGTEAEAIEKDGAKG